MDSSPRALNIPNGVLFAGLLMFAVHVLRVSLPDEEGFALLVSLAFIPARYAGVSGIPGGQWSEVTSFITYMFVHGGWTHLVVNLLWMLAFGSAVAKRIGTMPFLFFSALCGIAGALVHLAFHFGEAIPVVGASAAISGQMAAALRFMFGAGARPTWLSEDVKSMPLAGISKTLANPQFLGFLAVWVLLNLLFGLGGVQLEAGGSSIAWEAHIGGFLFGLFAIGLFDRLVQQRDSRRA